MTIKIGQLRKWKDDTVSSGEIFLVVGFTEVAGNGDTFADYIMNGERGWDDNEWIEKHSEAIDEETP